MNRIVAGVYVVFKRNRFVFLTVLLGSFSVLLFLASRITLEEDITQIMPKDSDSEKFTSFFRDSKFTDKLVITVSLTDTNASDPDLLIACAARLADTLGSTFYKPYVTSIRSKVDETLMFGVYDIMYEHLPVFLTETDYKKLDSLTQKVILDETFKSNYATLLSPASIFLKNFIIKDPVGITGIALGKLQNLQLEDSYELYEGYIITRDRKKLLLFVIPANPPNETSENGVFIAALDRSLDALSEESKHTIKAEYFGAMPIAAGNAQQIKKDIILTVTIALACILLLLWWYFKDIVLPFIILIPVLFGGVFSLAVIYLLRGHISVIALGAGAVVLGIAIDYSLHIFTHYKHTRSIDTVITDVATPMLIGCITTVGAFLSLLFVKSGLLHDFGLFCGLSLIGSMSFSLFFLPQLIRQSNVSKENEAYKPGFIDRISMYKPERNIWFAVIVLLLTIIFLYTSRWTGFESDMKKMNFIAPALQEAEKNLNKINPNASESVYLVFNGNNSKNALKNNEKTLPVLNLLREKKIITRYTGVTDLLVSDSLQNERIAKWNKYWSANRKEDLKKNLAKVALKSGFKKGSFSGFEQWLGKEFQPVNLAKVSVVREGILDDYMIEKSNGASLLTVLNLSPENKKEAYALLSQNPDLDIIDKSHLTNNFIRIIHDDFNVILALCSSLVFIILLISFGRIELTAITFIPMAISWIWILGIMGLLDIKFNIVNIIIATFIFGLGDDYSIFIMDGLLQEYKTGKKNLSSYKASIFLSATTTVIGVGVLILADHPALKSIALISIIGIVSVVIISYTLIPLLFNLLISNRTSCGLPPLTLNGLFFTLILYVSIAFTCIALLCFRALLWLLPAPLRYKIYMFHYGLFVLSKCIVYILINVKKNVINKPGERFATPCVVVCNHQSSADILLMLMLHPKLIMLTNEWVWNSPVIGLIVKLAGFQTTSNDFEGNIPALKKKTEEGYSIVIFPEGTRSVNGEIKRFHKGAFFLAEKLNLDILPVIIHGTSDCLNKNDSYVLNNGQITIEILSRISSINIGSETLYREKTKSTALLFKEEYAALRVQCEVPAYFYRKLRLNYIYKGPVTEWYVGFKLKIENYYTVFVDLLPREGYIVDIGCGYGVFSYLLHLNSKNRRILGIDYDADKIEVAQNGYLRTPDVNFASGNILSVQIPMADAFVIIDVLHYMEEHLQQQLITTCTNRLKPGGVILIRDSDCSLNSAHSSVKYAEFLATSILGFNKSVNKKLHFISADKLMNMVDLSFFDIEKLQVESKKSNTVYRIRHKQL